MHVYSDECIQCVQGYSPGRREPGNSLLSAVRARPDLTKALDSLLSLFLSLSSRFRRQTRDTKAGSDYSNNSILTGTALNATEWQREKERRGERKREKKREEEREPHSYFRSLTCFPTPAFSEPVHSFFNDETTATSRGHGLFHVLCPPVPPGRLIKSMSGILLLSAYIRVFHSCAVERTFVT